MTITIQKLVKQYGSKPALNIDALNFEPGITYGIVGHNGAGKTTLFKCMTNIITDYDGFIAFDGDLVREKNSLLQQVGIVLDDLSVYQNQSGWFNLEYFAKLRGHFDREKTLQLATELDLQDVLNKAVKTYSYGMQKKLVLLIAILNDAKVLILDEPFRGLDVTTVDWFKQYLKQLTKEGRTLLISSHVQNDLEALCDEIYIIDHGQIKEHIDVHAAQQKALRLIATTDNEQFKALLTAAEMAFTEKEDHLLVDTNLPSWQGVYDQLNANAIVITDMTKVQILADKLN